MPSLYSRLLLPRLIDCACGFGVDPGVEMHPLALRRARDAPRAEVGRG